MSSNTEISTEDAKLDALMKEVKLAENPELLKEHQEQVIAEKNANHVKKLSNEPQPDRALQEDAFKEMQNMSDEDTMRAMVEYFKELSDQWDTNAEKALFVDTVNALAPIVHKYTGKRVRGLVSLHTTIGFFQSALETPDILSYFDNCLIKHMEGLDIAMSGNQNNQTQKTENIDEVD